MGRAGAVESHVQECEEVGWVERGDGMKAFGFVDSLLELQRDSTHAVEYFRVQ